MKIQFEDFEVNLQQITQLCGTNFRKKRFILCSLIKYFSGSKYAEYEKRYQDTFKIDNEVVGRKYFLLHTMGSRDDLVSGIGYTKNSLMMQYIVSCLNEFDCQTELDKISVSLCEIFGLLNQNYIGQESCVQLSYEEKELLEMVQSSKIQTITGKDVHELSNLELFVTYLDLLKKVLHKSPEKMLLIFDNIDHMLEYDEYVKVISMLNDLSREFDVWSICTTSIEGFVDVTKEYFKGINVVNSIVYGMPEFERIELFVKERYPSGRDICEKELLGNIREIVQKIGMDGYTLSMQSNVYLKLINESLCIRQTKRDRLDELERSFIKV